jgi:Ribbon-helix-helix protein, copG family
MKTVPLSIRLDKQLLSLLAEGARRTPLNRRELLRRTLRLHLREVIEREAATVGARITNIDPWPRGRLTRAYRRVEEAWDRLEAAATAAQGRPAWDD